MPREDQDPERSQLSRYLRYSHVGLQFFIAVALFTGGGIWLDRRLGTGVLFTLLGLALGFAGGFYRLYRDLFPEPPSSRSQGASKNAANDRGREGDRKDGRP